MGRRVHAFEEPSVLDDEFAARMRRHHRLLDRSDPLEVAVQR